MLTTAGALLALSTITLTLALPTAKSDDSNAQQLDWTPCNISFGLWDYITPQPLPYECANLSVPLDYTNEDAGNLNISMIRVESLNKPSKGSILFNPGGPGGSGIMFVAQYSEDLHEVLGGDFDLIGFDPRGTGKTMPFNCNSTHFPGLPSGLTKREEKLISNNLTESLFEQFPLNQEFAKECQDAMEETGSLVGTAFVARDMLEIVKALDEDGLLNYWGTSYGTYLGTTFAAMFPDKVGRILLDGNINPHDWRSGLQLTNLLDTDKAFRGFLTECIANPDRCALAQYAPSGEVDELVDFINRLKPVLDQGESLLGDWGSFKRLVFQVLYDPSSWSYGTDLFNGAINGSDVMPPAPNITEPDTVPEQYDLGRDSLHGIACSDSLWRVDSPDGMLSVVEQESKMSQFADVWYPRLAWVCPTWRIKAKEIYDGDFTATTNNPLLFVNGIYDPVTPIVNARNASAGFEGSVLLQHNGYGHGLEAHPSLCTAHAVRAYFADGTLPEEGTECEPDVAPFDLEYELLADAPGQKRRSVDGDITEEDARLLQALRNMSRRKMGNGQRLRSDHVL